MHPRPYLYSMALFMPYILIRYIQKSHFYRQTADMTTIQSICRKHHLRLLKDAAQAHGAMHHGIKEGTLGDGAGFSFYPGKNLGTFGDGGAVVTDNPDVADYIRTAGNYGSEKNTTMFSKG